MVISLTFGILLGVPDATDSATRLVSLLPEAALDNENLDIAIGDLVGCRFGSSRENSFGQSSGMLYLVKLQMHTYDQCIDERISASFHPATTKTRPDSLADQCDRDNWIINVLSSIKRADLVE